MSKQKEMGFDFSDIVPMAAWEAWEEGYDVFVPLGPQIDPNHEHTPDDPRIFVFGSNVPGLHGGGAAGYARDKLGAKMGVGEGLTGNAYALPTCYMPGEPITLQELVVYVDNFLTFASDHPDLRFFLSKVGCGIAGFDEEVVKTIFQELNVPENVDMPPDWYGSEVD